MRARVGLKPRPTSRVDPWTMASGRDLLRQWKTEALTSDAKARIEKKGKKTRFQIKPWDDEHSLTSDEEYPELGIR